MGILGVHHIAVICSDYEQSKAFYSLVLGFRIVREVYRAERRSHKCDLALADGTQLELFSFPGSPARLSYPEAQGLRHLAFVVEDLDREIARLSGIGAQCEPVRVDEFTGRRFTFLKDPDGLPLELYER